MKESKDYKDGKYERSKAVDINIIIYILIILSTIITMFIVYKDIKSTFAIKFVIGYVIFLFLYVIYILFSIIFNARKLKWVKLRKRLIIFISLFVLFGTINYILDYIFRPSKVDLFRAFCTSFGLSLGIYFCNLMFLKKKEE